MFSLRRLLQPRVIFNLSSRNSGYIASSLVQEEKYPNVERVDDVNWKYVQRLLPVKTIPKPTEKDRYPSGWIPPKKSAENLPFFIARTRNYQPPVFLEIAYRGQRRRTVIENVQGDMWALEADLRKFLTPHLGTFQRLDTQVHELANKIKIRGDYVHLVLQWLYKRGF